MTGETPAGTIRRAAALMRERAAAATPGPWLTRSSSNGGDWYVCSEAYGQITTGIHDEAGGGHLVMIERDHRDAEHIASWPPLVALAVADVLDNEASAAEALADEAYLINLPDGRILELARAYLGEVAS